MIRSTDLCVHHSAPPTNRRCPHSPNSGVDMKVGEYGGKKGREVNEVQRRWDQKGPNGQEQRSWKPCEMRGKSHLSESHLTQADLWELLGAMETSWTLEDILDTASSGSRCPKYSPVNVSKDSLTHKMFSWGQREVHSSISCRYTELCSWWAGLWMS